VGGRGVGCCRFTKPLATFRFTEDRCQASRDGKRAGAFLKLSLPSDCLRLLSYFASQAVDF
jgi:hypothetical protein